MIALVAHLVVMRSSFGVLIRGVGGNARSVERAGWSVLAIRAGAYAAAGFLAILAGIALVGLTTSADANIALRYTLLSIAGVILGGGEFVGGRVSPIGAVIGALTLTLAGSFLSFLRISPDWQIGAQGAILIIVSGAAAAAQSPGKAGEEPMIALSALARKPWIWSFVAVLVVWVITVLFTGGASSLGLTQAALTFAAFSVIVGIGQMFVITLGPGNIDLSVPATMTLAGTVALKFMDVDNGLIAAGLADCHRGRRRRRHRQLCADQAAAHSADHRDAVDELHRAVDRHLDQSRTAHQAAGVLADFHHVRHCRHSQYCACRARSVGPRLGSAGADHLWPLDLGHRPEPAAARMAGIPVDGARFVTYVLCAVLAAICGYLLASFSGGAALNMGAEYLLMSIAVVVIGGTAVAGGNSNVPGIWGASLFMFLVVSMLNTYGFGAGVRLILTGLIIIAVILVASGRLRKLR